MGIAVKKGIKVIFSLCIILFACSTFFLHGTKPYRLYKDYFYQNTFSGESARPLDSVNSVSQSFTAKGNILNSISLYLSGTPHQAIQITISDHAGREIVSGTFVLDGYHAGEWNKFSLNSAHLKRNKQYNLVISSEQNLSALVLSSGTAPVIFTGCNCDGTVMGGSLAAAFQFTYSYMTLGGFFELVINLTILIIMTLTACYTIYHFETMYDSFLHARKIGGVLYAIYFSVSLTLLYCPLDSLRNEVSKFDRVIGWSLAINSDITRRISNFNLWFILLALFFVLFYLFFNDLFSKMAGNVEASKVISCMDDFIVLADCILLLRCITYFSDRASSDTIYYFSSYVTMFTMTALLAYILLKLDKNISADEFLRLLLIGMSVSYPVAIIISIEWEAGKVVLGIMAICLAAILIFCKYAGKAIRTEQFQSLSTGGVLIGSMLPIVTSVFMELIHVLNQYSVFIAHPARLYKLTILILLGAGFVLSYFLGKKSWKIKNWKKYAYPFFIFGATCLSIQIPIQSTYGVDIFEDANYSILISGFLNYGKIPIIEHYGGHMMTDVWEGILYALVNNDYAGAAVSPYSAITIPFLALLFFCFIKYAWNEDIALFVTLLFPFMPFWKYYGLGFIVCLAVVSYFKRNSYIRAAVLWAALFFCATYRLDLGFAFGIASVISMLVYAISKRNLLALKELFISLAGFVAAGGVFWFLVCIIKGINPVNRFIEFLALSLSNQNWAFGSIGDSSVSVYSWSYVIIPFLVVICLSCTVFSKNMKNQIGEGRWILLLVLGFSYVFNFSRGLVRHSLAEGFSFTIIWTSYVFLSMYVSCLKNNGRLLVPVYMCLILCHTLFAQDTVFAEVPIADTAMSKPASIIESWKPSRFDEDLYNDSAVGDGLSLTYWEKLKKEQTVVERVLLNEDDQHTIDAYAAVLNALLDENETFVDFMNRTSIYPIIGKENPAYASQSPLQLSGEFAQEQFIMEIRDVPLILMPIDSENACRSSASDGIANAYRYYKVSEYIYQNYVPLCRYEDLYAVWCLAERYPYFRGRLESLTGTDYSGQLADCDELLLNDVALEKNTDGTCTLIADGPDPMICELQNLIGTSAYIDTDMPVRIRYSTDTSGKMQVFYTTEQSENYTSDKVVTVDINGSETADFTIPITAYTRLRLDIPENSTVILSSLNVNGCLFDYIDYGYDGPFENPYYTEYISFIHNYNHLEQLPRIWSESDTKNSAGNQVLADLVCQEGFFLLDTNEIVPDKNGNYLNITATYDGNDTDGAFKNNDELLPVTVVAGHYENGHFSERCRFGLFLTEGTHNYLIRISADYYWYLKEINAVQIEANETVHDVSMQILDGD